MAVPGEPIAIIGTGCRFPGNANTPSKLWDLLREPRDLQESLSDRFNTDGWHHENGKHHGHCNVKASYLLSGKSTHRQFDAQFFGINAIEASTMDPQMRLLLETVYEAIEAAGQPMEKLRGSDTAVYSGMMTNSYKTSMERDLDNIGTYHVSGTSRAMMSNRISYFFDWHGPSMTIDTACSSSMIAVHQAVQQLRTGHSRIAVAAGSNLLLDSSEYVSMSKLEMLSRDSRSRMWDKDANGYARGEGVAAVVLKTLSAAEADGDHIECVIRETATNQDGRTQGITMPSAAAQTKLMRDCYARAGLDPANPGHRPQYFEAHGTGTPAGDPIEAEAIKNAFFPSDATASRSSDCLFVGGIKTVIGHSESVSGLAGLIKTSLALQNSVVPPNLLFNQVNPKVEQYCGNLRIPTHIQSWPKVYDGSPRRACVNSFGFGGSNSFTILESYTPSKQEKRNEVPCLIPLVFSAASEASLSSILASFSGYLRSSTDKPDLRDLALTLYSRRSRLHFGAAFSASSIQDLCSQLEVAAPAGNMPGNSVGTRPSVRLPGDRNRKPKVLGVFTGQGAQSARMGAALIENSASCQQIIDKLETRLAQLPQADRPSWSLKQELLRDSNARIGQAGFSQPLCTALQILQVDMLRAAGLEFSAVLGHSSGEIAAAYAAGMISAEDAICISYYRGLYAGMAAGTTGQGGAMLAVGTSLEDAQELCNEDDIRGRVVVAAINSSTSVTLSGDEEAIEEIKVIFEDESKFVRALKVDKAYHSHHMAACSNMYLTALERLDIRVRSPTTSWFSSVHDGKLVTGDEDTLLQAQYWNDNMMQPVMFMQAVEKAWQSLDTFDLAVELGPHPALKAPTLQTIQELSPEGQDLPYTGIQKRGEDAVECGAAALGYIWTHLGNVDLPSVDRFLTGTSGHTLITGLPPYSWDHEKEYWHESRYMRAIRTRAEPWHELLGHLAPDSTEHDMRWKNHISPLEVPWLKGHAVQQQAVFPAAGYVVAALEATAAMAVARGLSVSVIEVLELDIGKAIAFDSDDSRFETICSLTDIEQVEGKAEAFFKFNAAPAFHGTSLTLHASGRVRLSLGEGAGNALAERGQPEANLVKIDSEEFYDSLLRLDYQYTGPFHALHGLKRRLGFATGYIAKEPSQLVIHPAVLDAAFQSLLLAQSTPNSGGIWSLHVPRSIRAIRVNPLLCTAIQADDSPISFDCIQPAGASSLEGDIDLVASTGGADHVMVQIEGLLCVPFARPTVQDDKAMFATTVWDVAAADAEKVAFGGVPTNGQIELARLLERMAIFFLNRLDQGVPLDHIARKTDPYQHYFTFASQMLSLAKDGKLPLWSSAWQRDSAVTLAAASEPYRHVSDVKLLKAIGDNIIDIATGKTQAIEVGMQESMLSKIYETGLGFQEHTEYLARLVKQIVHRYPRMNILEVGAGTGGATKRIFHEVGAKFSSYTYTDISSGFFETAQHNFSPYVDKMVFKTLDISRDIRGQGLVEHSYDLIIASAVLHATPNLRDTLNNVRRLMKPGGFLVVLELHVEDVARVGTIFGALPGWWLGVEDGRTSSPCINLAEWDDLLRATGFSGCDTVTPVRNGPVKPLSVFVSQAVDDRVEFLRAPLSSTMLNCSDDGNPDKQNLILLGGSTSQTSRLVTQLRGILSPQWPGSITAVCSMEDMSSQNITSDTSVLSLVDIDQPVFQNINGRTWDSLRLLLQEAGKILWVSSGRRARNPHANMMVGLLRAARLEIPTLAIQSFDSEAEHLPEARELAETLLRLEMMTVWQRQADQESLLWTIEPELVRQEDGTLVIPRVVACPEMNDRYNSSRREIFAAANALPIIGNMGLVGSDLRSIPEVETEDRSVMRVTHSLRSAVRITASACAYLVLGKDCDSGEQVVALSGQNSQKVLPLARLALSKSVEAGRESAFMTLLAFNVVACAFLAGMPPSSTAVIHEPDEAFATVAAQQADRQGIKVIFTTTSATVNPGWIHIHPKAANRTLRGLICAELAAFLDFSGEHASGTIGSRLRAQMPSTCLCGSLCRYFVGGASWTLQDDLGADIQARLSECTTRALAHLTDFRGSVPVFDPSAFSTEPGAQLPHTVVDWTQLTSNVPVRVYPAESHVRFSDRKTYWLAGLSGGLGLLLCEWMARRGAKYVVISSREPRVDEAWLEKMRAAGVVVKIYSCDITDKSAVEDVFGEIRSSLPPISGVCQGAMVLEDTAIRNMSLEALLKVTKPKVQGSLYLDQLFRDPDSNLDFFIFFSSVGSVAGRPGQSNYAAANLFMTALAEQRRCRGQSASIMHIGPVFGAGYMTQQGLDVGAKSATSLKSMFPISERDFFQNFAEAVIAARSRSRSEPLEITTGLVRLEPTLEGDPFLSHYTQDRVKPPTDASTEKPKVPLAAQLTSARGRAQVAGVIHEALLLKLSVLFQIELSRLEQADPKTARLDEMGIDSLLAVEIRGWFVKALQVNIPVLKILGGASVADLIATAMETIPRKLVPNIDDDVAQSRGEGGEQKAQRETVLPPNEVLDSTTAGTSGNTLLVHRDKPPEHLQGHADRRTMTPTAVEVPTSSPNGTESHAQSERAPKGEPAWSGDDDSLDSQTHVSTPSARTPLQSRSPEVPSYIPPTPTWDLDQKKHFNEPIVTPEAEKTMELSFSQSLFWFSSEFSDGPRNLNLTATFGLTGELDVDRLKSAVIALGQQHESLRTRFSVENGRPVQGIMSTTALRLEHYSIRSQDELDAYVKKIHNHVYDLEGGRTVRLALVSMSLKRHFFIIGVHHLAMDGQSFFPLMSDMLMHYNNESQVHETKQYGDFSQEQHSDHLSGRFKDDLAFWAAELGDMPPAISLPRTSVLTSRPTLEGYGNRQASVRVDSQTKALIQTFCRRSRVTPFHFYLAVFRVLLYRYTGSEHFSIGIGDANRTEESLMGSIGDLLNMLPLVFRTNDSLHFEDIIQETRSKVHAALAHSRVPFQVLLNELGVERSATTTPIFQAFIDYRLARGEKMAWGEFHLELLSFQLSKMAYDVALDIVDNANGDCSLAFIVRDDVYSQQDVAQLANSYVGLAKAFAAQPMTTVGNAAVFDEVEVEEALKFGRGKTSTFLMRPFYQSRQWDSTIVHRVDDMAKRSPMKLAVITGDGREMSYDDVVNDRAQTIASELVNRGITTGSRIAVFQEPTADWVSSILAVMRVGGAYLPLDVGMPSSRLAAMIKDCQPKVILVDQQTRKHVHMLGTNDIRVLDISTTRHFSGSPTPIFATPDTVSTILYTSGSSGTPKGIMLTHQGLKSWLEPCGMLYGLRETGEVILQQSSQGFDMSLMQIMTALCFGGTVCLLPRKYRGDARAVSETITRYSITHTYGTPSECLSWLRYADSGALRKSSWKTALVGGERLAPSVLKAFAAVGKQDLRFHHMYGTTESTFCAAVTELDYASNAAGESTSTEAQPNYPAGVALPNYNVYILDEQRKPVPAGLQGEIYIGGAGVSLGYLNNASLTAETFVPDPFATPDDLARGWKTMQKTGDLGRWSPTHRGSLLIEGRISDDTMVKLRGLRVDLREVELAILRAGAGLLTEAVVSVRRGSPDSPEFLVAHVVDEHPDGPVQDMRGDCTARIRAQLDLPLYMRPAFIVALDKLPMTASGKLDRKAVSVLPLPEMDAVAQDVVWTDTERILKTIWADVLSKELLNVQRIAPDTDFFHIGGSSLLLLELRDKIRAAFGVDLSLLQLFESSVLSSMAHRIQGQSDTPEVIDWEEETKLRSSTAETNTTMLQRVPKSDARVVILTGGSGYLGKALVHALIRDPTIKEIHCLGVRNVGRRTDLKGLPKVRLHEGDLVQPRIGLSKSTIDHLFRRAHLIIHNGSDISYMKTYHSIRQSNFLVTKDLIEWSMPRMVPFHYVSSAGIGNFAPGTPLAGTSMASTPPPTDGSMGYTACKWASEVFLEKLVEKHPDWPVCVHRPALISRDDIPQLDGMHNILWYARELGAVPEAEGVARGVVNVVELDTVVTGIVDCALARQPTEHRPKQVHFVNHAGPLNLPLGDMRKWALERKDDGSVGFSGVRLDEMPLREWVRRAGELGMHPIVGELLTSFARGGEVEFPAIADEKKEEAGEHKSPGRSCPSGLLVDNKAPVRRSGFGGAPARGRWALGGPNWIGYVLLAALLLLLLLLLTQIYFGSAS